MIDKTYSNCGKELPYMYEKPAKCHESKTFTYLYTYLGISQEAKSKYPYLCPTTPILAQQTKPSAPRILIGETRWLWNSSSIPEKICWRLLLAQISEKLRRNKKDSIARNFFSFHFGSFHFYYFSSLPVEILSVEQTAAKFFTNCNRISDWIPLTKAAGFTYYS